MKKSMRNRVGASRPAKRSGLPGVRIGAPARLALATCAGVALVACSGHVGDSADTPSVGSTSAKLEVTDGGTAIPARKPLVPAQKPKAIDFSGRRDDRISVKFAEGSHVRLLGGALDIPQSIAPQADAEDHKRLSRVGLARASARSELGRVRGVLASFGQAHLERSFTVSEGDLDTIRASAESRSGAEQADLNLWYEISVPSADAPALLAALNASALVETAYPAPIYYPAAFDTAPPTPSYVANQGYLNPGAGLTTNGGGVDAKFAWTRTGGAGTNVRVVDVEWSWNTNHEDLGGGGTGGPSVTLGFNGCEPGPGSGSCPQGSPCHGTAVLGVIRGTNNGFGVTGIANAAQYGISGITTSNTCGGTIANAIMQAANTPNTATGDIILIEAQIGGPVTTCPVAPAAPNRCYTGPILANGKTYPCSLPSATPPGQYGLVPVSWNAQDFQAIKTATAAGRVVIEAAGNGEQNLDAAVYNNQFNRSVNESGSIMVGAAVSSSRNPECFSNIGSRVDVSAWGDSVRTLGYSNITAATFCPTGQTCNANDQNQWYATGFSGTSSASAIIAGVAASVQGACKAGNVQTVCTAAGTVLPPYGAAPGTYGMRELLSISGTPQPTPVTLNIGPMANLRGAISTLEPPATGSVATFKWTSTKNAVVAVDNLGMVRMRSKDGTTAWTTPTALPGTGFPPGAPLATGVATSTDIRLYGFKNTGGLFYARSTSGGTFSTFAAITGATGPVGANLATGMRNSNQLNVFWVDANSRLMTTFSTGSGTTWSTPSVVATGFAPPGAPLATGRQSTNQLDVFAIGSNGALKVAYATDGGSWQTPVELTDTNAALAWSATSRAGGGVATGRQSTDQLDVFFIGTNGIMNAMDVTGLGFWDGPWELHTSATFATGSMLSTINHGSSNNTLDVFAKTQGTENLSFMRVVGLGSWSGPTAVGMPANQTINSVVSATAQRGTTAADVVAIGSNGLEVATATSGGSYNTFSKLP